MPQIIRNLNILARKLSVAAFRCSKCGAQVRVDQPRDADKVKEPEGPCTRCGCPFWGFSFKESTFEWIKIVEKKMI